MQAATPESVRSAHSMQTAKESMPIRWFQALLAHLALALTVGSPYLVLRDAPQVLA